MGTVIPVDSFLGRIFGMLTFTTQTSTDAGINRNLSLLPFLEFLGYKIPYDQWIILFVYILMGYINFMYRDDKKIVKHDPDDHERVIEYRSTAAFYEAKCDSQLRKKFPQTSKYINRVAQILFQFIIIIILMIQGVIVVSQPPSCFFWGFLLFSLTL